MPSYIAIWICFVFLLSGCENTDVATAVDAGRDAVKAITLSDQGVHDIAAKSAQLADKQHVVAPANNKYVLSAMTSWTLFCATTSWTLN